MSRITLNETLINDYRQLFDTCLINADRTAEINQLVDDIAANRNRYEAVAKALGMPWFVAGLYHHLGTRRSFEHHLHNGDPLIERTMHHPSGRPATGEPPFNWEDSAIDALKLYRLEQWQDWSIPGILFKLEGHDTWNYRLHRPAVYSPYLWCWSNHYQQGRYIAGDTWSSNATARNCGGGVLLRRMAERGLIDFSDDPEQNLPEGLRLIRYTEEACVDDRAIELQAFLNRMPGVFLRIDGWPGPRTSAALHQVTGHRLAGDPAG